MNSWPISFQYLETLRKKNICRFWFNFICSLDETYRGFYWPRTHLMSIQKEKKV